MPHADCRQFKRIRRATRSRRTRLLERRATLKNSPPDDDRLENFGSSNSRETSRRDAFELVYIFLFFFLSFSLPRAFHFAGATAKLEGVSSERTVNAEATNPPRGESTVTASSVDRGGEQPRSSVRSEFLRLCRVSARRRLSAGAAGKSTAAGSGGGGESTRRTAVNRQGATIPAGRARKRYSAPVPADRSGQLAARPACY